MKQQDKVVMTVEEVAKKLRVDPRTVYRMIEQGMLQAIRVGRLWRIPQESLDRLLRRNE